MLPVPRFRDRRRGGGRSDDDRPLPAQRDVGELVARAAEVGDPGVERRGLLAGLARALAGSAQTAGIGAVAAGHWLADVLAEAAPRIVVRDAAALREHHPGLPDDEIADRLVRNASIATGTLGAAAGGLAAAEFAAPPTLLAVPVQLAAETLAIAAIEVKLVAELHELYGEGAGGSTGQRGSAYLMSWVRQRAVEPAVAGTGLAAVLGGAAKRELRNRLLRRAGRSTSSLLPFFAGAAAGAEVNRRTTRTLGEKVAAELRGRRGRPARYEIGPPRH